MNSPKKTYSLTVFPLFNQFLMDFVRFRVGMDIEILSYHFGIHASNVSCTLKTWINVLYEHLRVPVKWPEREQLYRMMPTMFHKRIAIIDYLFEVFIDHLHSRHRHRHGPITNTISF